MPALVPSVIVSVAPTLVDRAYVVRLTEVDLMLTTVETAVAVTPMACKEVSPFIAEAMPEAMLVSVSPESTV